MAIVYPAPDSVYALGKTWDHSAALEYVDEVIAAGADMVDVGRLSATPREEKSIEGGEVDTVEEIQRMALFIAALCSSHPDPAISIDNRRHEVGHVACAAEVNLVNGGWCGGADSLAAVAAEFRSGHICTHAGSHPPRTRSFQLAYRDIMREVIEKPLDLTHRATHLRVNSSEHIGRSSA
jgi:dihydropteroate synthase